jgi:thioester reductase-like protein
MAYTALVDGRIFLKFDLIYPCLGKICPFSMAGSACNISGAAANYLRLRDRSGVALMRNILITGATGFLGIHLLSVLLESEGAHLTLLSRADPKKVLDRFELFLAGKGAGRLAEQLGVRVTVIRGNVARQRLGLGEADLAELADRCDEVWHCAGDTRLDAELDQLRATNVAGVESVLEFARSCRRGPRVLHVSTAFVAGARRRGRIHADELDDTFGFETHYERSKFEAEWLLRDWAVEHGRPAVVFRPSLMVTDQPYRPGMPGMGLSSLWQVKAPSDAVRSLRLSSADVEIRLAGDPHGHLNILPVESAAELMVRLARQDQSDLVDTHHVVHGHEVPNSTILEVLSKVLNRDLRLRCTLVPEPVPDPSGWERLVARQATEVLPYLWHRRRYDDTSVHSCLGQSTSNFRVDLDYLLAIAQKVYSAQVVP